MQLEQQSAVGENAPLGGEGIEFTLVR